MPRQLWAEGATAHSSNHMFARLNATEPFSRLVTATSDAYSGPIRPLVQEMSRRQPFLMSHETDPSAHSPEEITSTHETADRALRIPGTGARLQMPQGLP